MQLNLNNLVKQINIPTDWTVKVDTVAEMIVLISQKYSTNSGPLHAYIENDVYNAKSDELALIITDDGDTLAAYELNPVDNTKLNPYKTEMAKPLIQKIDKTLQDGDLHRLNGLNEIIKDTSTDTINIDVNTFLSTLIQVSRQINRAQS